MKVCGFTIVRNAVRLDYPIVEAITSILPLCDEIIVAVGKSADTTVELIQSIHSEKIRIVHTEWDETNREGGRVLALETNKAFAAIPSDADWCFYIQADEVLHEQYYPAIMQALHKYKNDLAVEGLLFHYKHFYGSYDYIGNSWDWYQKEIRIVRNDRKIYSYRDAQGFRKIPNDKLCVKPMDVYIYHYGFVRDPRAMQRKEMAFHALWHDDQWLIENVGPSEEYDFSQIDSLERFDGTHPKVMQARIARLNWKFTHDISRNKLSIRERIKRLASKLVGHQVGEYKNYKVV